MVPARKEHRRPGKLGARIPFDCVDVLEDQTVINPETPQPRYIEQRNHISRGIIAGSRASSRQVSNEWFYEVKFCGVGGLEPESGAL